MWRCGNRGNVASVLIEKPAKGDWRALVDGEFDLPYAALLETVKTNACFTRIAKRSPEFGGLCNADWAWHGRMSFDALIVPESERDSSSPTLRVIRYGKGRVMLWQMPPWMIDEKAKPYLRTSKRHANAMAARLLANLGAGFETPLGERFAVPVERAWRKSYYLDLPEAGDAPYRYYRW